MSGDAFSADELIRALRAESGGDFDEVLEVTADEVWILAECVRFAPNSSRDLALAIALPRGWTASLHYDLTGRALHGRCIKLRREEPSPAPAVNPNPNPS